MGGGRDPHMIWIWHISGQDLCCLPTQYRDLVEDTGLTAMILTRCVAVQSGLGLCH